MNNKDPFARFNLPPQQPSFGTEAHKMARRDNISTSKEAAASINAAKMEQEVYECIKSFGASGCTAEEVTDKMDKAQNSVQPRFAPLIRKGLIVDTGERRKASTGRRQRVVVADVFVDMSTIIPVEKKVKRCPHCGEEI